MINKDDLNKILLKAEKDYSIFKNEKLNLNMTRGKPSSEQLNLSNEILGNITNPFDENNIDTRNYGGLDGIEQAKTLFADYMDVKKENILVAGNSSLSLMHDHITQALLKGFSDGERPWSKENKITFLCPVPGYDRHFNLCQHFGIEMIPIEMNNQGPNMDQVETLVAKDSTIKGIWCVPKYSNPTGVVYSDETVLRLAKMDTKAKDFRIFWDNAYAVHFLEDEPAKLANLLALCEEQGHANRALMFGSTSKISFAGAGIGVIAASKENLDSFKHNISFQTIGHDKINQLRHVNYFKNMNGILEHMKKHAEILKPKFDMVQDILKSEIGHLDIANWTEPKGGYFISIDVPKGCASRVVELAKKIGVQFTGAGATFPYKKDPNDSNIRIAPSLPSLEEIKKAMEVLCCCIKIAYAQTKS